MVAPHVPLIDFAVGEVSVLAQSVGALIIYLSNIVNVLQVHIPPLIVISGVVTAWDVAVNPGDFSVLQPDVSVEGFL